MRARRIRCPKCDGFTLFDPSRYEEGQALVFVCEHCAKQFRVSVTRRSDAAVAPEDVAAEGVVRMPAGFDLLVLGNAFGAEQRLPLLMGDNIIGKYFKGCRAQCAIESSDPSLDLQHAVLTVRRDKHGALQCVLRDGPSYVGTFVGDELLADRERRVIAPGDLFTLGATTIILTAGGDD